MTTTLGTRLGTRLGTVLDDFTKAQWSAIVNAPTFDATKLYGLTSFSAANFYQTQAGGGEAGVTTGFGNITLMRLASVPTAVGVVRRRLTPSTAGWQQYVSGTAYVSNYGTGAGLVAVSSGLAPSDATRIHALVSRVTATPGVLEQAVDGVWNASTPAMSGYGVPGGATLMRMGLDETGANPATTTEALGGLDFRGTPTRAQLDAVVMLMRTLGDVPSKAAAEALMPVRYGVRGFSTANYLQAGGSGGIRGSASGFWISFTVRPDAVAGGSTGRLIASGTQASNTGFIAQIVGGAGANLQIIDGAAAARSSPTIPIASIPTNEHVRFTFVYTGAALRSYMNGVKVGGDAAATGYTAPATAMTLGFWGTADASSLSAFDLVGGDGFVPSDAEVLAQHQSSTYTAPAAIPGKTTRLYNFHADAAAVSGALPTSWLDRVGTDHLSNVGTPSVTSLGATITHRWSLRDTLAAANVAIVDGAAAPAAIPDSVTLASVDAMTKAGSPVVRVMDPSVDGRRTYGALGFSATSYLRASAAGIRGAATGFTLVVEMNYVNAATASAYVVTSYDDGSPASSGAALYVDPGFLRFYAFGGPGSLTLRAMTVSDYGRKMLVAVTWDGATWRAYVDGAQVTSAAGGFTRNTTTAMYLGRGAAGDPLFTSAVIPYRVAGCDVALTAAEVADLTSAWSQSGTFTLPAGKPNPHFYDLTQDITANGGPSAGMPATVQDRVGTDHLTRVGTGLQVSQRTERLWSYEATPILYGGRAFSSTSYLRTATAQGLGGDAGSFWALMVYRSDTNSIATSRHLMSCTVAGSGWIHYASANNSVMQTLLADGGGTYRAGPTYTLAAADVGKLQIALIGWDNASGRIRVMAKRVEQGAPGVAMTGFTPSTSFLDIGNGTGAGAPLDGITWVGAAYGTGAFPTLAQYQATYDAIMATEDVQPMTGTTTRNLWSVKHSVVNGAWGATVADQAGSAPLTVNGTPTLEPIYARAWGT